MAKRIVFGTEEVLVRYCGEKERKRYEAPPYTRWVVWTNYCFPMFMTLFRFHNSGSDRRNIRGGFECTFLIYQAVYQMCGTNRKGAEKKEKSMETKPNRERKIVNRNNGSFTVAHSPWKRGSRFHISPQIIDSRWNETETVCWAKAKAKCIISNVVNLGALHMPLW